MGGTGTLDGASLLGDQLVLPECHGHLAGVEAYDIVFAGYAKRKRAGNLTSADGSQPLGQPPKVIFQERPDLRRVNTGFHHVGDWHPSLDNALGL